MLTVFASHTGKTLELDCSSSTRVHDVQVALAALTGIPEAEQIITCDGVPLTPSSLLSAYGLHDTDSEGRTRDVFLYSRALLRPDAPMPRKESLQPLPPVSDREPSIEGSAMATASLPPHPLDSADSPLLRALPQYCRQFRDHLEKAQASAEAGAARIETSCRLLNEAEVQALSVDAAMASVEPHYAFVCNAQATFQDKFSKRYSVHEDVLSTFEADMDFLHSVELPHSLASAAVSRLSDLCDATELRRIAAECARSHRHFASRVASLDAMHAALRSDVESLFMRTPTVDLESLMEELVAAQSAAEDQAATVQALQEDLRRAEAALEEGIAGAPSVSGRLKDAVGMLEAMHESHVTTALPLVKERFAIIEACAERCVEGKNALAADALRALRTIASEQSRIREMRETMVPFPAALERQDAQIGRLLLARRLPAAYKQSLAECARRAAFNEKYSAFASDLAERMGKFRQKEVAVREKFRRHVTGLLPVSLLRDMGLDASPPHCQVSVPGDETSRLLPVTSEDLRRLQLPRRGGSGTLSNVSLVGGGGDPSGGASSAAGEHLQAPSSKEKEEQHPSLSGLSTAAAKSTSDGSLVNSLQMENARLRAELASQIALDCIRAAECAGLAPAVSPSTSPRRLGGRGSSSSQMAPQFDPVAATTAASFLGPEAAVKFERALAAKDALLKDVRTATAAVEESLRGRIRELEAQVSSLGGGVSIHSSSEADASMPLAKASQQSEQSNSERGAVAMQTTSQQPIVCDSGVGETTMS